PLHFHDDLLRVREQLHCVHSLPYNERKKSNSCAKLHFCHNLCNIIGLYRLWRSSEDERTEQNCRIRDEKCLIMTRMLVVQRGATLSLTRPWAGDGEP